MSLLWIPINIAVAVSGPISKILPYAVFLLSAVLTARAWSPPVTPLRLAKPAGLAALAFGMADLTMLGLLPRLGLSYGSLLMPLAALVFARLALFLTAGLLAGKVFKSRSAEAQRRALPGWLAGVCVLQLSASLVLFQGLYIEPFRLGVSRVPIEAPAFLPDRPLRIAQLTDTHVERITPREIEMLELLKEMQPDLIVMTGDYINADYTYDPLALQEARTIFSQLSAPLGVYAVNGNVDNWNHALIPTIFDGLPITLLQDEVKRLELPGGDLYLVGVSTVETRRDQEALAALMEEVPVDGYSLLLYHIPNLMETAAANNVDLYLAGHTHGGQVRLPFYGAIFTLPEYSKEYEMGLAYIGGTTLYVSRGIGMEGLGLPRIRLLCPPEIALFELAPSSAQE
ncbi:MAG: metallophosphoesterase [Anaerolineales bacterium]|nr:metallophosphoesterase [Anaerolineales bacterium]